MAIADYELVLAENQDLKSAFTSKSIDLGQKNPDLGMYPQLAMIALVAEPGTGTGTITFNLQDSDDDSSFTTVASLGPIKGQDITDDIALKLPFNHRRYVRLNTVVSGTLTLTGTVFLGDNFDKKSWLFRDDVQYFEPDPDAMKIDLTTKVKGVLPKENGGTGTTTGTGS